MDLQKYNVVLGPHDEGVSIQPAPAGKWLKVEDVNHLLTKQREEHKKDLDAQESRHAKTLQDIEKGIDEYAQEIHSYSDLDAFQQEAELGGTLEEAWGAAVLKNVSNDQVEAILERFTLAQNNRVHKCRKDLKALQKPLGKPSKEAPSTALPVLMEDSKDSATSPKVVPENTLSASTSTEEPTYVGDSTERSCSEANNGLGQDRRVNADAASEMSGTPPKIPDDLKTVDINNALIGNFDQSDLDSLTECSLVDFYEHGVLNTLTLENNSISNADTEPFFVGVDMGAEEGDQCATSFDPLSLLPGNDK